MVFNLDELYEPRLESTNRTGYILKLQSFLDLVLLFLRPRRFGKSLTLSMLTYFHGVEHKTVYDTLFKVNINNDSIFLIFLSLFWVYSLLILS